MSTSQIIGYVAITASENQGIEDTSDRERLVQSDELRVFQEIIRYIVAHFETERDQDRQEAKHEEPPLRDLFKTISASPLTDGIDQLVRGGADASETLFWYLSLDASLTRRSKSRNVSHIIVGSPPLAITQMLVHEVGNKTLVIGRLLTTVRQVLSSRNGEYRELEHDLNLADRALKRWEIWPRGSRRSPIVRLTAANETA